VWEAFPPAGPASSPYNESVSAQPKHQPESTSDDAEAVADVVALLVAALTQLREAEAAERRPAKTRPVGLGPCDVITVPEAVAILGMREPDARRWLAEHDLVHDVAGRERVIAGDLVEAIRGTGKKGPSPRAVAPVRRLPLSNRV
jgi:hypothetical protein